MIITFADEKLKKTCNSDKALKRAYGDVCAKKIRNRLDDMAAATTLADCKNLPGRYHELKGDRQGQLACDAEHPKRVVFRPEHEPIPTKDDGGLAWDKVTAVCVIEIEDYHG